MNASLVYPADMPFLAGRYAYDRLADDLGRALGAPVALCPLSLQDTLPGGGVILHATPVARALGEAASRTVIVNADPAHLPALMETQPLALVTKAAMAVWRVEPEQAASAGIWVRGDSLEATGQLAGTPVAELAPFSMIAPKPGVSLAHILASLLLGIIR